MTKHVVSVRQFLDDFSIDELMERADWHAEVLARGDRPGKVLDGRIMASLFYEPSTRTRFSFEAAMKKLGGSVISTENAREFSSAIKGESLHDTVCVVSGYADVIVLRHPEIGSAEQAAKASNTPVISAGDGAGEHPTQALLDFYTIGKELGRRNDFTIAMIGDLHYGRTVHSLVYLISTLCKAARVKLVSPETLRLPEKYKEELKRAGIQFDESDKIEEANTADVLYVTRVQKERFASPEDYQKVNNSYGVTAETLKRLKEKAVIMHPLPRVTEISPEVDKDPRAAYFRQAHNGVPLRMALLQMVLKG